MLDDGIIRPSSSPWSSPIWIVPKKRDASNIQKWRIVIDYRRLNEKTIEDRYPIPNITDILDKLGRSIYFTTLDLAAGFHQIEMHPNSIEKTAFNVNNGHYEFLRMPFGLRNSPSTFQRCMDNVLRGLQGNNCLVYMDDIIIYSSSLKEHIESLTKVFSRLKEHNLKVQLDKSEFLCKSVKFLGHLVTENGIKPNPDKIRVIEKFPIPKTQKDIKSFLGLIGYYRKFVPNFAKITKPLTNCLKKNNKVIHDENFLKAFNTCKTILMNDPLLQHPDFTQDFNVTTDASNYAIGAILSQGVIGKDKPIAYASRTLNNAECNYSTIEKELLAIVYACKTFRPYLFGRRFNIISDHKPLQWLMNLKEPQSRLVRWRLKLEEFDYQIIYKKGTLNTNADALSRVEIHPLTIDNEIPCTSKDPDNQSIIANIDDDEPDDNTIHTALENPIQDVKITDKPINYYKNQIFIDETNLTMQERTFVLDSFEGTQRRQCYFTFEDTEQQFIDLIKNYFEPGKTYAFFLANEHLYPTLCKTVHRIFKNATFQLIKCNSRRIDVFDKNERNTLIKHHHEISTVHRGINEVERDLRNLYYWPTLRIDTANYINKCKICLQAKYERNPIKPKLEVTQTPKYPFEIIHMDTLTINNEKFLIIIDVFSKYGQAYHLNNGTSIEVVNKLIKYMSHHGIPTQITTDNGPEFKTKVLQNLASLHKIQLHFTTPYHPNSNSPVERFNSTLIEHIRILRLENKNSPLSDLINYAIFGYNNTIHSSTKLKPFELISGHLKTRDIFDINNETNIEAQYVINHKKNVDALYQKVHNHLQTNKEKLIDNRNKNLEECPAINPDSDVYLEIIQNRRSKTKPKYATKTAVKDLGKKVKLKKNIIIHKQQIKRPRKVIRQSVSDVLEETIKDDDITSTDPDLPDNNAPGSSTTRN